MKLEDQVTSLELSKKLKELGVKQESLFWWTRTFTRKSGEYKEDSEWYLQFKKNGIGGHYSAFTVAELGEMLPKRLVGDHPLWYLTIHCNDNYYSVDYETFTGKIQKQFNCQDRNESNARAKMLIYLLENKLIVL